MASEVSRQSRVMLPLSLLSCYTGPASRGLSFSYPAYYCSYTEAVLVGILTPHLALNTVNVEIFAQDIFSRISRRAVDARKYDVSEKIKYYSANRINC